MSEIGMCVVIGVGVIASLVFVGVTLWTQYRDQPARKIARLMRNR